LIATDEFDIALIDARAPRDHLAALLAAAKSSQRRTFLVLVADNPRHSAELREAGLAGDGAVVRPANLDQAKLLIDRCIRVRMPSWVLMVDDSATMRNIVRKLLNGTPFALDIAEAEEGIDALKQIASGKFDIVFLDYNMPGLNGVETLSEIKRQYPRVKVVIMTSTQDETVAERARAAGAAAFLRKPFYPADVEAVLYSIHGLRV
jgi:CheY-like chemotaxis protein